MPDHLRADDPALHRLPRCSACSPSTACPGCTTRCSSTRAFSEFSDDKFFLVIQATDPKFDSKGDGRVPGAHRWQPRPPWWRTTDMRTRLHSPSRPHRPGRHRLPRSGRWRTADPHRSEHGLAGQDHRPGPVQLRVLGPTTGACASRRSTPSPGCLHRRLRARPDARSGSRPRDVQPRLSREPRLRDREPPAPQPWRTSSRARSGSTSPARCATAMSARGGGKAQRRDQAPWPMAWWAAAGRWSIPSLVDDGAFVREPAPGVPSPHQAAYEDGRLLRRDHQRQGNHACVRAHDDARNAAGRSSTTSARCSTRRATPDPTHPSLQADQGLHGMTAVAPPHHRPRPGSSSPG